MGRPVARVIVLVSYLILVRLAMWEERRAHLTQLVQAGFRLSHSLQKVVRKEVSARGRGSDRGYAKSLLIFRERQCVQVTASGLRRSRGRDRRCQKSCLHGNSGQANKAWLTGDYVPSWSSLPFHQDTPPPAVHSNPDRAAHRLSTPPCLYDLHILACVTNSTRI